MLAEDKVAQHFRLMESQRSALRRLRIETVQDLLFHFPFRYEERGAESAVAGLAAGQEATVVGTLEKLETKKSWKRKIPVSQGYIKDESGRIKAMWFNQPYIAKMWQNGALVKAVGKVSGAGDSLYLANPELQRMSPIDEGIFKQGSTLLKGEGLEREKLSAQYPESRGVSSLWFRHAIEKLIAGGALKNIEDPIPKELLEKYNLPSLKAALHWIHAPRDARDAEAARKRFAFEEVFLIQLERAQERLRAAKERSFTIAAEVGDFMEAFPFRATNAQKRAVDAILKDLKSGRPMSRLLEGDVGSGKTAVAATAAYATVSTRPAGQDFGTLQVAYMAPTEILAKQHFDSFIKYFERFPINIGLITGGGCYKFPSKIRRPAEHAQATTISRAQLLKWVANGEIPVVLGTHALIEKAVQFKHLALVIIDEQHRFGTNQRRKLARKEKNLPHLLSMTATPIPRTLALTIYGDLDLTLLDEMPPGRKHIITEIVSPQKREEAYEKIRKELRAGRQAYVICPRIDEPDPKKAFALQAKSVKAEAKRLKKDVFKEFNIEVLHSKIKTGDKDEIMRRFLVHEIDILVATSVVEVGVNVQNATVIMIEGAERFGLSQLHQLRGRVVRSTHQAYCFVVPESKGERTMARLRALSTAKSGFELAEEDLKQRGAGQLAGIEQSGISDLGMEALKNLKLVEAARQEAKTLVKEDEALTAYPALARALAARTRALHFE